MKYYLIVGEASGDLHASNLMKAIKSADENAEFRFFGGDLMSAVGGTRVKHYRELAYMGFIPVLMHLHTILKNMSSCKRDIVEWAPDALVLVDYPGFNLSVAEYIHKTTDIPVYYYISPKIWAWKERRIKNIKRDVDELYHIVRQNCVNSAKWANSGFSGFVVNIMFGNQLAIKNILAEETSALGA